MYVRSAGPRVPEETACETEEGGWDADGKSGFGDGDTGVLGVLDGGAEVVAILRKTGQDTKAFSYEEGQLDEAALCGREVVKAPEDEGNGLGGDEDEAIGEGGPEGE